MPAEPVAGAPRLGGSPPLLAANGDLVIESLLDQLVAEQKPLVGLVQLDRGRALELLAKRAILLAGFHGELPPSHIEAARLARIHLVKREVGLAFPRGSRIRKIRDLAKKRIALRPPTAGIRAHFDQALAKEGVTLSSLRCRPSIFESHRDADCAVLRGEVDVALSTAAWAERLGLGFLTLASESYDLLLHAETLGASPCVAICEVAQSAPFRKALGAIAGYDARGAGEIRYER